LLTCAHTAWKSTSAPLFFCTSSKETVENLKISRGQLAPCQENWIKRQQTVSFAGCKVLVPSAGFLLASMPSYCRFKPTECSYSESVSVSVPQDKIRGSAIPRSFLARLRRYFPPGLDSLQRQLTTVVSSRINHNEGAENARGQTDEETGLCPGVAVGPAPCSAAHAGVPEQRPSLPRRNWHSILQTWRTRFSHVLLFAVKRVVDPSHGPIRVSFKIASAILKATPSRNMVRVPKMRHARFLKD